LAERALAAGFGGGDNEDGGRDAACDAEGDPCDSGPGTNEVEVHGAGAEEIAAGAKGAAAGLSKTARTAAPISGSRAERYQVMLHVEAETLRAEAEGEGGGKRGRSELEDGTRVAPSAVSRFT
jgi:hypothetical protein